MTSLKLTAFEAETLLRGAVIFKFEGDESADTFAGSPFSAGSLKSLLASIVATHTEEGRPGRAEAWRETYRLAGNISRWEWVAKRTTSHPRWNSLTESEKRAWTEVLAAPYRLEDGDHERLC
ncbi:hypothetical protein JGS22_013610 [Streptomyces sp. P38-E01]|uniref:Uncharacterized protein n=1 Tax=Streptomyces tardus TaxID=2780544 RepID=A0A949N970_9ACTN|nr:hypothetical protein [Streptomyces tardus]MBU7598623.1 hypothetical protein [Streptomyces tardus]